MNFKFYFLYSFRINVNVSRNEFFVHFMRNTFISICQRSLSSRNDLLVNIKKNDRDRKQNKERLLFKD